MKLFSMLALIVALGVAPAFAQQEVDPDHFDAPATKAAVLPHHDALRSSSNHKRHQVHMAKHSGARLHHHARVSA